MRRIIDRLKWMTFCGIVALAVVTLWAQEPQQFNRGINVIRGNVLISAGWLFSGNGVNRDFRTNTSITTGGNATYTAAQVLAGYISRSPGVQGGNMTDALPTAALLAAAIPGVTVTGLTFSFIVDPGTTPNGTLTINGSATGVTYAGRCGTSSSEQLVTVWINFTSATAYRAVCDISN